MPALPLRVFVYEYTCATADSTVQPTLHAEGWAMLSAVVADLGRVANVATVTLLGEGLPKALSGEVRRCDPAREQAAFRELAAAADCTLAIAPEFDRILAERCRWVLEAGGRLLGPSPNAVELTADKLRLAAHLRAQGVPTPPCATIADGDPHTRLIRFPAVLKARYGAGSQSLCLVPSRGELGTCRGRLLQEAPGAELVLQPLVEGLPASAALLVGPDMEIPLAPAAQHLSADGRFRYLGGTVPLPLPLAQRARRLARRAVRAVSGLHGYVGVDLVLGPDGPRGDRVIEINPRLTTSYIGLRALTRDNLADILLRVVAHREPVGEPAWLPGPVHFCADGTVTREE